MYSSPEGIIKNLEVFEENYIPDVLWVRSDRAQMLINRYIRRLQLAASSTDVTLIYGMFGRVGIGKTTIARYVGRKVEQLANRSGYNFKHVYVNIFYSPTFHEMARMIVKQLIPKVEWRGVSLEEITRAIADYVYRNNLRLLIILDEIQALFKKKGEDAEKLYTLLRLYEIVPDRVEPGSGVDIMLVAQSEQILSYLHEFLPQVESQISLKVRLEPYTVKELYKILLQRAEIGLYEGTWDDSILQTIAEYYGVDSKIAKMPEGSARKAIIALRTAAEIAESEGKRRIMQEHLSKALGLEVAAIDRRLLQSLSKHELLLLLAIAELTMEKNDYSITSEVRSRYEEYAAMYGEKPRGHTQINEYLRRLSSLDLIIARPSSKGVRGRTTLIRLAPEIPADMLRSELILLLEGKSSWS